MGSPLVVQFQMKTLFPVPRWGKEKGGFWDQSRLWRQSSGVCAGGDEGGGEEEEVHVSLGNPARKRGYATRESSKLQTKPFRAS